MSYLDSQHQVGPVSEVDLEEAYSTTQDEYILEENSTSLASFSQASSIFTLTKVKGQAKSRRKEENPSEGEEG